MHPKLVDILRAFWVCGRLLQYDLGAVRFIGASPAAARASFTILPVVLVLVVLVNWPADPQVLAQLQLTPLMYALLVVEQSLLSLLGFFLLARRLTQRLSISERWPHYVAVQNWLALPLVLPLLLVHWLLPEPVWAETLVFLALLGMSWLITRATLRLRPLPTLAFCILEVLFGQLVQQGMAMTIWLTYRH